MVGGFLDFMLGGFVHNKDPNNPMTDEIGPLQIKCMQAAQKKKLRRNEITEMCGTSNIMWKPGILDSINGKYPKNIAAHFSSDL